MNTTNMRHKDLTFNISGNRVRLKPSERSFSPGDLEFKYEICIYGLTDDMLTLYYNNKESMLADMVAFNHLFHRLRILQPESWGNLKGVMSRGETQLMRLAILCGGISVLACLVYLLVILFK
jgi:hypothetical protein